MLVLSLRSQIEEAAAAPGWKNASGNVTSFEDLLTPESFAQLEEHHPGMYAFLAFHPEADRAITDYVREGTLASDAGPRLLVFFTLDAQARFPTRLGASSFSRWGHLDASLHPAYQLVRMMFLPGRVPELPGLLFFARFSTPPDCLYVKLDDPETAGAVRARMRFLSALADEATRHQKDGEAPDWMNRLALSLEQQSIPYVRSQARSPREWLASSYRFLDEHKGDLVSLVKLLKDI